MAQSTTYRTKQAYETAIEQAVSAAKAYYDTGEQTMDDARYDDLVRRIAATEMLHPQWKTTDITSAVGGGVSSGGEVVHSTAMLSLENAMDTDELSAWFDRLRGLVGEVAVCVEPKLDGLAVNIRYENGSLAQISTRGDGRSGEEVTNQGRRAAGIPSMIPIGGVVEVRGEIYMSDADFAQANEVRRGRPGRVQESTQRCGWGAAQHA